AVAAGARRRHARRRGVERRRPTSLRDRISGRQARLPSCRPEGRVERVSVDRQAQALLRRGAAGAEGVATVPRGRTGPEEAGRHARLPDAQPAAAERDLVDGVAAVTTQHGDWQLDRHARRGRWRRVLLLILVLVTAAAGTFLVVPVVSSRGPDWLKIGFLPAFVLLFAWAAL